MTSQASRDGSSGADGALPQYVPPIRAARQSAPRAAGHWLVLLISAAILVLAATMSIGDGSGGVRLPGVGRDLPSLCSFRRLAGIPCPGCGVTRCFISLAHGDLPAAWRYNPGGVLFFALVAAQIPLQVGQLWRLRQGRPAWRPGEWSAWLLVAASLLMIGNWAAQLLT